MARRRYGFRWLEWEILVFIIYLPFQVISHFLLLFIIDISSRHGSFFVGYHVPAQVLP